MTKQEAYEAFQRADDIWQIALESVWGVNASFIRRTSYAQGEEGSDLRKAFDAREEAHNAWLAANNCGKAVA
jgi:hypothetical protein